MRSLEGERANLEAAPPSSIDCDLFRQCFPPRSPSTPSVIATDEWSLCTRELISLTLE
jgi:hypothetical protein